MKKKGGKEEGEDFLDRKSSLLEGVSAYWTSTKKREGFFSSSIPLEERKKSNNFRRVEKFPFP